MSGRREAARALLPLLLSMASLCVGTSFAKTLFPVVGPAGMTALRIGLGASLLAVIQRPWRWRLDRDAAITVVAYGAVLGCMNLCFYAAVARLPLGVAIAIEFLGPLGLAVAGSRRAIDLLWVVLAAAGVGLLVLRGAGGAPVDLAGTGFALAAAVFWAGYIVIGKRASTRLPIDRIIGLGLFTASLIAVPVGVAAAGATLLRGDVLLAGALVAFLCSLLPYSLELVALRRLSPRVFGIAVSLEPAIGALAAFAVLGETLSLNQWLGMAAVGAASVGAVLHGHGPPAEPVEGLPPA